MAKRFNQLQQLTAAQLARADQIAIRDDSAGQVKYITVGDLTGAPEFGWQATAESHAYSSWNATTRIGVVTIPTDGTTKYTPGMRYRFSQTTGGTKYAIIHAVTATTLTLFFPVGTTLNNETITSPVYSNLDTPFGFDKDPVKWSLDSILTTDTTLGTPVLNTWYNLGSHSLTIGPGSWELYGKVTHGADRSGAGRTDHSFTLSTSSSTESHPKFTGGAAGSATTFTAATSTVADDLTVAATTTVYALTRASGGGTGLTNLFNFGAGTTAGGSRVIRVTSSYL